MRTLNNYLSKKEFVQLNESQLFIQHGSDLDSVMYKLKAYTNVTINNRINESANNFAFTDNESNAIMSSSDSVNLEFFTRYLEDYKRSTENSQFGILGTQEVLGTDSLVKSTNN